ncbi:MraY family glycosyltransferase [Arenimonas sp.]|uniref:MraY family glycosyltransferase n=1 Tax=Arenimonas sp. TaxID=1872635 RepID=UPI0039E3F3FD
MSLLQQIDTQGWMRAAIAFALVAVLIPLTRPLAERFGLTDRPDLPGGRKQHQAPTAMHGGLVILFAMTVCAIAFGDISSSAMLSFYLAGGMLLAVGVLDDLYDLNWKYRIGVQVAAALVMAWVGGVSVQQLSDVVGIDNFRLAGWLSLSVTIFVVVGVINALNMADGVDGLAGGQALVSLALFAVFALYAGNNASAERLVTAAAAVAGFLLWNMRRPGLPRARVFLGDAGSMVLGFVIAWTAVRLSQNPEHPVSPVLGPWTIALPLIDCVSLILRRLRQGRSPFAGDRDHLHHLLLDAGYSPTAIAIVLMLASAGLGFGAAIAMKLGVSPPLLVVAFFVLIAVHYRLTADRERAVKFFRAFPVLRRWALATAALT